MKLPSLIKGGVYSDKRGTLFFNNDFDLSLIKRMYIIQNENLDIIRGWQGHKIEQRWFNVIQGGFKIEIMHINNWESPSLEAEILEFELNEDDLDVLHIPSGYITSIQSLVKDAKLLVMSDFLLGENNDEYRFDYQYFKKQ